MTIASKIVRRVATIDENKSVLDAAKLMTEEFIGSAVVPNIFRDSKAVHGTGAGDECGRKGEGPGKGPHQGCNDERPINVSPNDTASQCLDLRRNIDVGTFWSMMETSSWGSFPSRHGGPADR
jgi:hypothetical protein